MIFKGLCTQKETAPCNTLSHITLINVPVTLYFDIIVYVIVYVHMGKKVSLSVRGMIQSRD